MRTVRTRGAGMDIQVDVARYRGIRPQESHAHSQLVLALEGGMEIEIGGKAGTLEVMERLCRPVLSTRKKPARKTNSWC